jgi:hypothetical protein
MDTYTNFSNGISSMGVPVIPGFNTQVTGNVYYVGGTAGSNWFAGVDAPECGSKTTPFKTIDYAVGRCSGGNGDVIFVLPSHTETITSTSTTLDVADVSIVGLGRGTKRPTLTFSTAAATINVTGANCSMSNIICVANYADVTTAFTVAAKDFQLYEMRFTEAGTDLNWFTCIATGTTDNSSDGLTVINCKEFSKDAAAKAFISILQAIDRVTFLNNLVVQAGATGDIGHFLIMAAKVVTNADIGYNRLVLPAATSIAVGQFMTGSSTTSTGIVYNNYSMSLDTSSALFCTATLTFALFENYVTGVAATQGALFPVADNPA